MIRINQNVPINFSRKVYRLNRYFRRDELDFKRFEKRTAVSGKNLLPQGEENRTNTLPRLESKLQKSISNDENVDCFFANQIENILFADGSIVQLKDRHA